MKGKPKQPQPREVRVRPRTYQPSKAELEEEFDMPGWSPSQLRKNVLGPVSLVEDENA